MHLDRDDSVIDLRVKVSLMYSNTIQTKKIKKDFSESDCFFRKLWISKDVQGKHMSLETKNLSKLGTMSLYVY